MKEKKRKLLIVTWNCAQLTVNGDLLVTGRLARTHAEKVRNLAQEMKKYQHQMEDNLVKEKKRKQLIVTWDCAQLTVDGDLLVTGRLAKKHAEEEKNLAQDK